MFSVRVMSAVRVDVYEDIRVAHSPAHPAVVSNFCGARHELNSLDTAAGVRAKQSNKRIAIKQLLNAGATRGLGEAHLPFEVIDCVRSRSLVARASVRVLVDQVALAHNRADLLSQEEATQMAPTIGFADRVHSNKQFGDFSSNLKPRGNRRKGQPLSDSSSAVIQ